MDVVKTHATRVYSVLVAVIALVAHYWSDMPTELVLGVAAALLGTGEAVQRVENAKTVAAEFLAPDGKHRKE